MFLRNQFKGEGNWKIPTIPKVDFGLTPFDDQRLIGFDKIKTGKDEHYNRIVHFFLYDYKFEDIWTKPEKYIDVLKKYKAVLSPDYSMYIEMNPVMQLYNTFRNRWVGAYLAEKGIKVVPTVSWGLENTFDFCFNGIEKGSTVAVSTYMVSEHGRHKDQKEFFLKGYNEMLKRIEPELIICYNTPFPEMEGNILFIDYDLSSWQHYGDDVGKSANTLFVEKFGTISNDSVSVNMIKKQFYGYVLPETFKGMGSAEGGDWQPAKEADKRFIGLPNTMNKYTTPKGELFETKIGKNGRAVAERHNTTHNREHTGHTDPHDHTIDWSSGFPRLSKPINYPDGNIPEFKHYEGVQKMIIFGNKDELQFESISDFKWCLKCGGEIEFDWHGKSYGIGHDEKGIVLYEANNSESEKFFETADDILDEMFDGQKFREIIKDIDVSMRTI